MKCYLDHQPAIPSQTIRHKFYKMNINISWIYEINIKRYFYSDVYTILNRIKFTIWTICAFRVPNPCQWSLAKQSTLKRWKWFSKSVKTSKSHKGWYKKTHIITISFNFNSENFDALKRYESTEVDRRTWLHVPSGSLWSTRSDTHQVVEI